jgi:hypothetical protein
MLLTGSFYEETEKETMPSLIVNVVEVFSLVRHHSTAEDSRWLFPFPCADGINSMES